MRIVILTVGKTKSSFFREAIDHYVKSIGHMAEVEYFEARDAESDREREGQNLFAFLEKRGLAEGGRTKILLLDVLGKALDSPAWGQAFTRWQDAGVQTAVFILGGAFGFADSFCQALPQAERLSLSKLTFPHELARVILCEQIYRALHIQSGSKYHHS